MNKEIQHIEMWTDGGISKNPGGSMGLSALLVGKRGSKEYGKIIGKYCEEDPMNTNNRSEMLSFFLGLKELDEEKSLIVLHLWTDSFYLESGINKTYPKKMSSEYGLFENFGHDTNSDLWEKLKSVLLRKVSYLKVNRVKGHSGVVKNELVDTYASLCMENNQDMVLRGTLEELKEEILG